MSRKFGAAILSVSLMISTMASAATGQDHSLAPGKPAGVKAAQMGSSLTLTLVGIAVVAGGIALAASGSGGGTPSVSTTGTAP